MPEIQNLNTQVVRNTACGAHCFLTTFNHSRIHMAEETLWRLGQQLCRISLVTVDGLLGRGHMGQTELRHDLENIVTRVVCETGL